MLRVPDTMMFLQSLGENTFRYGASGGFYYTPALLTDVKTQFDLFSACRLFCILSRNISAANFHNFVCARSTGSFSQLLLAYPLGPRLTPMNRSHPSKRTPMYPSAVTLNREMFSLRPPASSDYSTGLFFGLSFWI